MKDQVLIELADVWELKAEMDKSQNSSKRETLRECADTLRLLVEAENSKPKPTICPYSAPLAYCFECRVIPCPLGLGKPGLKHRRSTADD